MSTRIVCNTPCAGLLLIGGPSGSGKTTTVQELIDLFPERYMRLPAISSRAPRTACETEYGFVTADTLLQEDHAGLLVNLDEVYGNLYAVRVDDWLAAWESERTPVKEVHMDNFDKFQRLCRHVYTVILTGRRVAAKADNMRVADDAIRYSGSLVDIAHMVVNPDHFTDTTGLALHIDRAYAAHLRCGAEMPDCRLVDRVNLVGYDSIASEFTESERITTRNFHNASRPAFISALEGYAGGRLLELGAGHGWLASSVPLDAFDCIHQDASPEMSSYFLRNHPARVSVVSPVRALPFDSGSFDLAVGSLIDGFIYPSALAEIHRVLNSNGVIVLSYPSHIWALECRGGSEYATFESGRGQLQSYSFSPSEHSLAGMMNACGFELLSFEDLPLSPGETEATISPALRRPDGQVAQSIVTVATARRIDVC